jgi:hypothetical protein
MASIPITSDTFPHPCDNPSSISNTRLGISKALGSNPSFSAKHDACLSSAVGTWQVEIKLKYYMAEWKERQRASGDVDSIPIGGILEVWPWTFGS